MPSLKTKDGRKNVVGLRVRELRKRMGLSQDALAAQLQLLGMDGERGVVKRIENGTRYVNDLELQLLVAIFKPHFGYVSYDYLIDNDGWIPGHAQTGNTD